MARIDWLTYEHFAGREGDRFVVSFGDGTLETELVEASQSTESGGSGPQGQRRRQFSLVFRGAAAAPMLPQGTYRLDHAELGELDLFLVPVGAQEEGVLYEAAFA